MENLEISARTVEEATKKALIQLNAGLNDIEITVLSEGRSGILGLGSEDARISVKLKETKEETEDEVISIAYDVLENILKKVGIRGRIVIQKPENKLDSRGDINPVVFNIEGADLGTLIGRRGQTLEAMQYLVRLIVTRKTKSKTPIMLDVQDYKKRRFEDLKTLALNVANQVKSRKTAFKLEPMSAFERRIIHMTLAQDPDVVTESIGEGEERKVVVSLKKNR